MEDCGAAPQVARFLLAHLLQGGPCGPGGDVRGRRALRRLLRRPSRARGSGVSPGRHRGLCAAVKTSWNSKEPIFRDRLFFVREFCSLTEKLNENTDGEIIQSIKAGSWSAGI